MFHNKATMAISYYALLLVLCLLAVTDGREKKTIDGDACVEYYGVGAYCDKFSGKDYVWCYTSNWGDWDYCEDLSSPLSISNSSISTSTVPTSTSTVPTATVPTLASNTSVVSTSTSTAPTATVPTLTSSTSIVPTSTSTAPTVTVPTLASNTKVSDGVWSVSKDACIKENNYKAIGGVETLDDCKAKCISELGKSCRSIDFQLSSQLCLISTAKSDSPDYQEPCNIAKGVEYTEILQTVDDSWTGIKDACIREDNYKTFGAQSTIDDCKGKCLSEFGKNCTSVTYQPATEVCLISETWSISADYEEPCSISKGVQYSEIPQIIGCGVNDRIGNRIVGGQDANPTDWPWMAALLDTTNNYTLFCGGVLITTTHVLTAAHCVSGTSKNDTIVVLGEYDFTIETDNNPEGFEVVEMAIHKDYSGPPTFIGDIAILKLDRQIWSLDRPTIFNQFVSPICLPSAGEKFKGEKGHVIGWGDLFGNETESDRLQEVVVHVWAKSDCNNAYPGAIKNTMFCAGVREGGKDSCQGDSGGPYMIQDDVTKRWVVAGIVSWGFGCAQPELPGVYTKVNYYLEWIRQNTGGITDL